MLEWEAFRALSTLTVATCKVGSLSYFATGLHRRDHDFFRNVKNVRAISMEVLGCSWRMAVFTQHENGGACDDEVFMELV